MSRRRAHAASDFQCVHEVIDVSGKASPETCARLAREHETFLDEITPGIRYLLTPIHAESRTAPPILHLEPTAPAGTSRMKVLAAARGAAAAREQAQRAFAAACEVRDPKLAQESDVLGALATAKPQSCGRTLIVIWSDLLHEKKGEVNLVHDRINRRQMAEIIGRLARKERWMDGLLANTEIRVVRTPPNFARKAVNNPAEVQEFFTAAARSLGAATVEVETYYAWGGRT